MAACQRIWRLATLETEEPVFDRQIYWTWFPMRTMTRMLDRIHGYLSPHDAEYMTIAKQVGYQALGLALGYVALNNKKARFTHVRAGLCQTADQGWKAEVRFRPHTMPKELLREAPTDVRQSLSHQ